MLIDIKVNLKHLRFTVSKSIKPIDKKLNINSEANRIQGNLLLAEGISVLFKNLKSETIPTTTALSFWEEKSNTLQQMLTSWALLLTQKTECFPEEW